MPGDTLSWAIIEGLGPKGRLMVRPGDPVRESVVASIVPGGVVLARGNRTKTLPLVNRWQGDLDRLMAKNELLRAEPEAAVIPPNKPRKDKQSGPGRDHRPATPAPNGFQGDSPWF